MMSFHGPEQSEALAKAMESSDFKSRMDEEELVRVQEQIKALDAFFANRVDAKYKVEIQFGKNRSTWKPFAGAMSLYLSGTKLNGGGDEKLFICPRDDCQGIIFPKERMGATVLCRECEMMWDEKKLVGELFFNLTPKDWAHVILKWMTKLELNADIYLKYHPTDIRYKAAMEVANSRKGEEIGKARKNRGLHIYPLKHIIQDTGNGANLYDRIVAFINS